MHHAVAQPTKLTTEVNALGRSTSKRSIHRALVKSFTCPPHTPPHSPTAPIAGQITVAHCNAPLNNLKPLENITVTSTCGQSASTAKSALLSQKAFPTSTLASAALSRPFTTLRVVIGHSPQPWKALKTMPSKWSKPLPSSVTVWLPAKQEGDVMEWLAHMPENCGGMHRDPMMGSGGLPEGRSESVCPGMGAGEPLEGRLVSSNKVSMSHGHSEQDSDYLACWPIPAWSMWCEDESLAWKAAQQSLDASVSLMIVHD